MSIPLSRYRHLIDLSRPTATAKSSLLNADTLRETQLAVLEYLFSEYSSDAPPARSIPVHQRLQLIRSLLTVRDVENGDLPPTVQANVDQLLAHKLAMDSVLTVNPLPTVASLFPAGAILPNKFENILFWRGDITQLASPSLAIVNACNSRLLGCFQPSHLCVDNVIHAAAGPHLRQDCWKIMQEQGHNEPEGYAKVTRGWSLPSGYVLHTVGPQLEQGSKPTLAQELELASCYTSCLDLAEELGTIDTVAFPAISTGLFAFPSDLAARLALGAVDAWLAARPSTSMRVVFALFATSDVSHYQRALVEIFPQLPGPPRKLLPFIPDGVRKWVEEADVVLIRAGAGLSAGAVKEELGFGLDYNSEKLFAKLYPGLLKSTKMRTLYHSIGYQFDDPHVKWAYTLMHAHSTSTWGSTPVYRDILQLAESASSYFVITTNADNLFFQSGFDKDRIYTPQGSYSHLQCLRPCSPTSFFPIQPYIDAALPHIHKDTMRIPSDRTDLLPKCEKCSGEVFLNVRGGQWFLDTPQAEQVERYEEFLGEALAVGKKMVMLEFGCGWNTPTVVRLPGEQLAREEGGRVKLIRINEKDADVPLDLKMAGTGVGLRMEAADFMEALLWAD